MTHSWVPDIGGGYLFGDKHPSNYDAGCMFISQNTNCSLESLGCLPESHNHEDWVEVPQSRAAWLRGRWSRARHCGVTHRHRSRIEHWPAATRAGQPRGSALPTPGRRRRPDSSQPHAPPVFQGGDDEVCQPQDHTAYMHLLAKFVVW